MKEKKKITFKDIISGIAGVAFGYSAVSLIMYGIDMVYLGVLIAALATWAIIYFISKKDK